MSIPETSKSVMSPRFEVICTFWLVGNISICRVIEDGILTTSPQGNVLLRSCVNSGVCPKRQSQLYTPKPFVPISNIRLALTRNSSTPFSTISFPCPTCTISLSFCPSESYFSRNARATALTKVSCVIRGEKDIRFATGERTDSTPLVCKDV